MTRSPAEGSDPEATEATDEPTSVRAIEVLGEATDEQVAALLAVISGLGGGEPEEAPRPVSRWASRERLVRRPVSPGPGGWRASAFPR